MDTPKLAELHGLSVAEALDLIYQRAIQRVALKLAACWARHERREERRLADQTRMALTTFGAIPTADPTEDQPRKSSNRDYKAEVRHLLETGECVSLTIGIRSPVRAQLNVAVPRRHDCRTLVQKALGRELTTAAEALISGLRKGTIEAEGFLALQPLKQIPRHLFLDTCTLHRQSTRLIVRDHRGKPTLTYSGVHLIVPPNELLAMGKAVRQAMDDLKLPIGRTSKTMVPLVREQLRRNGFPVADKPSVQEDEALRGHIKRAQKLRSGEARRKS